MIIVTTVRALVGRGARGAVAPSPQHFEIYLIGINGNPKECDTRLCLHFFGKNLVNPRIATHNFTDLVSM